MAQLIATITNKQHFPPIYATPEGANQLLDQVEYMELDALNIPKLEKAWEGEDPFTFLDNQVGLLGNAYLKYNLVTIKSKSNMIGSGALGVKSQLLKELANPHKKEI